MSSQLDHRTELKNAAVPILGFAAYSGTGKTTLLVKLLPLLRAHGFRIGLIKHAHHDFDVDQPGKDSYELRQAGANPVLIASRFRWTLMAETPDQDEPRLDDLLANLDQSNLDLVLVEGFKHERFAKIELHRPALSGPLLYPNDPSIIAIASDAPLANAPSLPCLDLNAPGEIAEFIIGHLITA